MDDTGRETLEVLSEDELRDVVGGMARPTVTLPDAQDKLYNALGLCRCGGFH